jgi:type I restriction enzyme S subunit
MNGWRTLPFSEAPLTILDGDRGAEYPKQSDYRSVGDWLFLNTGNVRRDGFDFTECQFILDEKERKLRKGRLSRGDIVMTTRGTIGNVGFYDNRVKYEKMRINSGMVVLRADADQILPSFLYQVVRSDNFRAQVRALTSGAAQPQLPIRDIKLIELPIPPIAQQRRITSILEAYDDLIAVNLRRIALLEEMARRLFEEWFVRFRAPGLVKQTALPDGWREAPLQSVTIKIGSGATPRGGKEGYKTDGISLIRSLNVYDYQFDYSDLAFIDELQAMKLDNVTVQSNDILLNITGASVARCCAVPSNVLPARVNQHVAIVRPDVSQIHSAYLLDAINSTNNKQKLLNFAQGGATREALTKETIEKFTIIVPPKDVLLKHAKVATPLHRLRDALSQQNQNLRAQRDLLLSKLISGDVSLSAAELDELENAA